MKVLGIETSTKVCSVGVADLRGISAESAAEDRHVHSDMIVSLIEQTMRASGLALQELEAVAVSVGPGSFTGLRIGMSAAKGLCRALKLPLVAVPTFEAVACAVFDAHRHEERVMVAVDAKRDDLYITVFEKTGEACRPLGETEIIPDAKLRAALGSTRLVCTDRVAMASESPGEELVVLDLHRFVSGARVAVRGRARLLQGLFSDVGTLEPLYLKDFVVRQPSRG